MKEEKFEKVVEYNEDNALCDIIHLSSWIGIVIWITSIIWVPIWWWNFKIPTIIKESRKVYWRKIK